VFELSGSQVLGAAEQAPPALPVAGCIDCLADDRAKVAEVAADGAVISMGD
jgi:hypothetical protein